jgi:hypothetical protein
MQPYPDRLGDFSRWEALDDMYLKIYHDTYGETNPNQIQSMLYESEILDRVGDHELKKRSFDPENTYVQEEARILSELGVPRIHQQDITGLEEQISTSRNFHNLYEYEGKLLEFQNKLARKNTLKSIFENDSLADSPFDIIKDLRRIDEIIFGEKYASQKPEEPSFLIVDPQTNFSFDPEEWQDQRKSFLESKFPQFSKTSYVQQIDSLTGAIAGIVLKPINTLLSVPSLVGESSTKGMFEHAGYSGTAQGGQGAGAREQKTSPSNTSEPLVYQVQTENIADRIDIAIEYLLQSNCIETDAREQRLQDKKENNSSEDISFNKYLETSNRIELFFRCQDAQKENFLSDLTLIREKSDFDAEKNHFQNIFSRLLNWNKDTRSFLDAVIDIREIFQKEFITKPQK